jgi:hypothetical protein
MTKVYFCGGSDQYWTATNANTINGAKAIASKTYQQSVGGKIEVGEKVGEGDAERIEKVAVKYGYDKWQTAS